MIERWQGFLGGNQGERGAFGATLIVLAIGVCLIFFSLGDRALWDDEAQTAVLGRQVLQHGLPMMGPADNMPTDRADRADFNSQMVFTWNTWLPHYMVAASFGTFGESEFAARLPFALTGLLTLALVILVARRMFSDKPWGACLALLFLALSVPFLLHVRQCRYYSPAIVGTLWMVYGYLGRKDSARPDWRHVAAGGVVCFYSFHITAVINGLALLLHALWRGNGQAIRELAKAGAAIVAAAVPAIIYMRLWSFPPNTGQTSSSAVSSFWVYLLWLNGFLLPLPLFLLGGFLRRIRGIWLWVLAYALFLAGAAIPSPLGSGAIAAAILMLLVTALLRARPSFHAADQTATRGEGPALARPIGPGELLVFFAITYVAVLSVMSQYPFYRYVVPLVPLAALFTAQVILDLKQKSVALAIAATAVLIGSNAISALPLAGVEMLTDRSGETRHQYTVLPRELWRWTTLRSDLASYLGELRGGIADPERCVADALRTPGGSDSTIKASYGDISLMYYAPGKRIVSRHVVGDGVPDVVIRRDPYPLQQDAGFLKRVQGVPYAAVELTCPNIIWSNNPDPLFHRYQLPKDAPPLVIYRRQETSSATR